MIREKFDNNIHMVRSYILWIEFFATIYRCSDYSGQARRPGPLMRADNKLTLTMGCYIRYRLATRDT